LQLFHARLRQLTRTPQMSAVPDHAILYSSIGFHGWTTEAVAAWTAGVCCAKASLTTDVSACLQHVCVPTPIHL